MGIKNHRTKIFSCIALVFIAFIIMLIATARYQPSEDLIEFEFIDKKGEVQFYVYDKSDGSQKYQVWREDGSYFGNADYLGTKEQYVRREGGSYIYPSKGNTWTLDYTDVYLVYEDRTCNFEFDVEIRIPTGGTSKITYGGDVFVNGAPAGYLDYSTCLAYYTNGQVAGFFRNKKEYYLIDSGIKLTDIRVL